MDAVVTAPTWIFDLDNTLHNASLGIFPHINKMMGQYIMHYLRLNEAEARQLREDYWKRYGATLQGLVRHHGIDPNHFLRETHTLAELEQWLSWESGLTSTLRQLPSRKILLSNGPQHYVEGLLRRMGIQHLFSAIYGIERLDFIPKPQPMAFRRVLAEEKLIARHCVMVEDSLDNLKAAKRLGMRTVWISRQWRKPACVDFRTDAIAKLLRLGLFQ